MAVYTVFYRSPEAEMPAGMALIRDGFCWSAFLFTFLWALGNRLWWAALGLAVIGGVLTVIVAVLGLGPAGQAAVSLGLMAMTGYAAGDLRGWALERRGYALADLVSGDGLEEAERRFLSSRPDAAIALLDGAETAI